MQSSCRDPQRFRGERGAKSWLSVRSGPQQIPWVERTQFGTERRQSSFELSSKVQLLAYPLPVGKQA